MYTKFVLEACNVYYINIFNSIYKLLFLVYARIVNAKRFPNIYESIKLLGIFLNTHIVYILTNLYSLWMKTLSQK